jgi:hypothetical protein
MNARDGTSNRKRRLAVRTEALSITHGGWRVPRGTASGSHQSRSESRMNLQGAASFTLFVKGARGNASRRRRAHRQDCLCHSVAPPFHVLPSSGQVFPALPAWAKLCRASLPASGQAGADSQDGYRSRIGSRRVGHPSCARERSAGGESARTGLSVPQENREWRTSLPASGQAGQALRGSGQAGARDIRKARARQKPTAGGAASEEPRTNPARVHSSGERRKQTRAGCVAPTALASLRNLTPALPGGAKLCRTFGAFCGKVQTHVDAEVVSERDAKPNCRKRRRRGRC